MSAAEKDRYDLTEAIAMLRAASVPVQKQAYGFSVSHTAPVAEHLLFGHCGSEHDGSITLCMVQEELAPIACFARFSFTEAAQLLVAAYTECATNSTPTEIVETMRKIDNNYDQDNLKSRLQEWCQERANETDRISPGPHI